jgi:DNA repair protein RecN (Recombination protein N)
MLTELSVENLLLIDHARLRLGEGLNVLTGETGAGKTVLAHALDLLLGGRARPGIVRPGAGEAYVEGVFQVGAGLLGGELLERLGAQARMGGTDGGGDQVEIVLARRVGADGRTRAYINARSATIAELRDLGARLISFYGQHEHRKLTVGAAQLEILDSLCGPEQALALGRCAEAFAQTALLERRLQELHELSGARERELGLLEHELAEIDAVAVDGAEHERLRSVRERLRRADALSCAAAAGSDALAPDDAEQPGAVALMAGATAALDSLEGVDPRLDEIGERLRALVLESQDLAGELRGYAEGFQAGETFMDDGVSLESLEERLAAIERLVRKHGGSIEAVLEYAAGARARREELAGVEVQLADSTELLHRSEAELQEQVAILRKRRRTAAKRLAREVREQLASLAMGEASFEVALSEREAGPRGADGVDFMIAPNPGVPAGSLREIASGGELSRVMLAIMSVANSASQTTIVFDEVDAGIGGHTARAVGARLQELGRSRQLLCITHLAQIASLAGRHFSIVKDTSVQPTQASVLELTDGEVVPELVRMLGADASDAGARRHARELRHAA